MRIEKYYLKMQHLRDISSVFKGRFSVSSHFPLPLQPATTIDRTKTEVCSGMKSNLKLFSHNDCLDYKTCRDLGVKLAPSFLFDVNKRHH